MSEPIVQKIGKNNVQVIPVITVTDVEGNQVEIHDREHPISYGTMGVEEALENTVELKLHWEDSKWVAEYVAKQIKDLDDKINHLKLVKVELEEGDDK